MSIYFDKNNKNFLGGDNMATKKKEEYITVTGLIGKRGWTRSLATKLLQNADYKVVDNPRYKCAAPMTLYYLEDIKRIEKTKKFKELKEKADKRKVSAKKAVETKINTAVAIADKFSITVERIDLDKLRTFAIEDKQAWYDMQWSYDYEPKDAYYAPEQVVKRWMVNYIRHNLSHYDEELENLMGRTGKYAGYVHYKIKLAEEMKKIYPEIKKEIDQYMLGIQDDDSTEALEYY